MITMSAQSFTVPTRVSKQSSTIQTPCQCRQLQRIHMIFMNIFVKTKTISKTVFACSYGAHEDFFFQKEGRKSRNTVLLSNNKTTETVTQTYIYCFISLPIYIYNNIITFRPHLFIFQSKNYHNAACFRILAQNQAKYNFVFAKIVTKLQHLVFFREIKFLQFFCHLTIRKAGRTTL